MHFEEIIQQSADAIVIVLGTGRVAYANLRRRSDVPLAGRSGGRAAAAGSHHRARHQRDSLAERRPPRADRRDARGRDFLARRAGLSGLATRDHRPQGSGRGAAVSGRRQQLLGPAARLSGHDRASGPPGRSAPGRLVRAGPGRRRSSVADRPGLSAVGRRRQQPQFAWHLAVAAWGIEPAGRGDPQRSAADLPGSAGRAVVCVDHVLPASRRAAAARLPRGHGAAVGGPRPADRGDHVRGGRRLAAIWAGRAGAGRRAGRTRRASH